jgi:hypothetical protein
MEKSERFMCFGFEDDSNICHCTCMNLSWMNKLDKLCKQYPEQFKMTRELIFDNNVEGKEYEFPKKLVSIRQPTQRKVSEEQKQAASERMKKMQQARQKKVKAKTD